MADGLLAQLDSAHQEVVALIRRIPDAALDWQPDPDSWSLKRTVAHVAHAYDFYVLIVEQARATDFSTVALLPDSPAWQSVMATDAAALACEDVPALLDVLVGAYERGSRVFESVRPEELDRQFTLSRGEEYAAEDGAEPTTLRVRVLQMVTSHLREHQQQLEDILSAWCLAQQWSNIGREIMANRPHEPPASLSGEGALSRRAALRAGAAGLAALLSLSHFTPALAEELPRLAGDQPMTGTRLAEILRAERTRWNALLDQVGLDRMDVPGVDGDWSVKQLVAHLTWYEQSVVEGAKQVASTGTFKRRRPEGVGLDDMNARIADEARNRPAAEVLAEAQQVFDQLLAVIENVPQDMLNDPKLLGLPDDSVPWMGVANNSYAHYRQHEAALRNWLAAQ